MNRRRLLLALSALSTAAGTGFATTVRAAERLLPVKFRTTAAKYMGAQPRVTVASYPMTFITGARGKASTNSAFGAGVDMTVVLEGPTETDMRALADEGLADLLARVTAAGLTVAPMAEVNANPELSKIKRVPGNAVSDSGIVDSRATKSWTTYGATDAPLFECQGKLGAGDLSLLGKLGKPSTALGAVFIQPRLVIDFTDLNSSKRRVITAGKASVGGSVLFSIDAASICFVIAGDKKGLMLFSRLDPTDQSISEVDMKGELIKNTGKAPVNAISIFGKSSVNAFRADVEAWKAQVRAAYRGYNQGVVDEIKKARG